MFFDYCILLQRPSNEFWESRPSQIIYCIEKYEDLVNKRNSTPQQESQEITSMREIAGWGDKV